MGDLQRIEADREQERRVTDPRWRSKAADRRNAGDLERRKLDAEANREVLAEADRGPEARKQAVEGRGGPALARPRRSDDGVWLVRRDILLGVGVPGYRPPPDPDSGV